MDVYEYFSGRHCINCQEHDGGPFTDPAKLSIYRKHKTSRGNTTYNRGGKYHAERNKITAERGVRYPFHE